MNIRLWKFFLVVFFFCSHSLAGDSVRNGNGLGEENIYRAYFQIESIYQNCLASDSCLADSGCKKLVSQLLRDLPVEQKTVELIQFFNESSKVPFKTKSRLGEVIYFNRQELYKTSKDGKEMAIEVPAAAGILTEALLVHQGVEDSKQRFYIGKSIEIFAQSTSSIFSR